MKQFVKICFLILFFINYAKAQDGDLFLQHYKIPIPSIDNQNLAVIQGKNGVMHFANTKGILTYDGVNWEIIRTPTTPYAFAIPEIPNSKFYVGCRDNFGYLEQDELGRDQYISISGSGQSFGQIIKAVVDNNFIYFYSDNALIKLNSINNKIEKIWRAETNSQFTGFFIHKSKVYVNVKDDGLYVINDDKMQQLEGGERFAFLYIRSFINYDKDKILFGGDNDWNYTFDGKEFNLFFFVAEDYLKGHFLSSNMNLDENSFVTSTLTGGCMIIEKQTGKTKKIINYQTGLPDDEVLAMTRDREGGIWICHDKGISRADMTLPVKTFSSYAGIDGNITTLATKGDTLLVATSLGLFYLVKVSRFEEVEGYIKKEAKYLKTVETITKVIQITEPKEKTSLRRYVHSESGQKDLKRKIKTKETAETEEVPTRVLSIESTTARLSTSEARKAYAMQSIPYIFKQVQGVEGKCRQIIIHQGGILVASNVGLFNVFSNGKEMIGQLIMGDLNIHSICQSKQHPGRFYVGSDKGLQFVELQNGGWQIKDKLKNLNDDVYSIVEHQNNLWLGSENQVLAVKVDSNGFFGKTRWYIFDDSYSESIAVRFINGKITCFLSSGVYVYNPQRNSLLRDRYLESFYNERSKILFNQADFTWANGELGKWRNLNLLVRSENQNLFLELFDDIQDIYVDQKNNYWVVNNNQLCRIDANAALSKDKKFNIFIKTIKTKEGDLLPLKDLILDYGDNTLSFYFQLASPFYNNESETLYQYWLENLEDRKKEEWSDWNKQALISFPFLPSGQYRFHVRAKNVFGQISQEQLFNFKITPPFWETTWFYALQTLIFLGLLILAFTFSRIGGRFTSLIAYLLSLITIITFFEFLSLILEPVVEQISNGIPFFKLGMNIALALSLAPLEFLFRKVLSRKPIEPNNVIRADNPEGREGAK